MDSEYAAELASTTKTRKLYVINGAKRYVEVIQCCGDDMNVALNTGLSPPSPAAALQPTVPSQPLSVVSCIPNSSLVLPGQAHIIAAAAASPVQPRSYLSPGFLPRTQCLYSNSVRSTCCEFAVQFVARLQWSLRRYLDPVQMTPSTANPQHVDRANGV